MRACVRVEGGGCGWSVGGRRSAVGGRRSAVGGGARELAVGLLCVRDVGVGGGRNINKIKKEVCKNNRFFMLIKI